MDDSVVGTSSIIDSFDNISLSPWNPRFIPNPVPMPDNKTWKTPSVPFIPEQTPPQVKEIEDLFKEGMGEDATERDATGNSSFLIPKSGGGGVTIILAPAITILEVYYSIMGYPCSCGTGYYCRRHGSVGRPGAGT